MLKRIEAWRAYESLYNRVTRPGQLAEKEAKINAREAVSARARSQAAIMPKSLHRWVSHQGELGLAMLDQISFATSATAQV